MSLIPGRSTLFDPFSLDIWDQFEGFPSNSQFRSLSDQIRSGFPAEASSMLQTRVDWKETPNSHIFKADVPGLKKEELKVEVEDGRVLRISGERRREMEEKTDRWHRVERSQGSFMRKFRLPEDARVDEVKAGMQDGVLTVTVPKQGAKNPNVKSVQIAD